MTLFKSLASGLALAGVLAAASAQAQSVSVSAANAAAAPGGTAWVDLNFDFSAGYQLLSLDLMVDYDANLLSFSLADSLVSHDGSTFSWADARAAVESSSGNSVLITDDPGALSVSAVLVAAPVLAGPVVLHAAFRLDPAMSAGSSTALAVSGSVADNELGVETSFSLSPTVSAVPEPAAWWLMAFGAAAVGLAGRRRAS